MKKVLILLTSIFIYSELFSQGFNLRYDFNNDMQGEAMWDVELQDDGYVIFGGVSNINTEYVGISIFKLNFDGTISWEKSVFDDDAYLYGGWANSTAPISDGYILGGGLYQDSSSCYLMKFDSQGDTIWTSAMGDLDGVDFFTGRCAIPTPDGGFIMAGSGYDQNVHTGLLIKTDQYGEEEWRHFYFFENQTSDFGSIVNAPSGGYLVGGQTNKQQSGQNDDTWLVRVAANGDELWQNTYGDQGFDDAWAHLVANDDNTFVFAASTAINNLSDISDEYPYISKINDYGGQNWSRTYGGHYWDTALTSIKKVPAGGYISAGLTTESLSAYEGVLVRIAENGDSLWMRRYSWMEENSCFFRDVIPSESGGFVAVGNAYGDNDLNLSFDGWVVKTDEYGCVVPGCQLGIEEPTTLAEISMYPNPASGITNVYLKALDPGLRGVVVIKDVSGRIINQITTLGGDINIGVDVTDMPSGIYFVQFLVGTEVVEVEKLMVVH